MIIGIVQARIGSTRLPGKVLREIKGKPLIRYLSERLGRSRKLNGLYIACPAKDADEIRAAKGDSGGLVIGCEGDENDVARRFRYVLSRTGGNFPKAFVRICADSPLIDPALVDWMVHFYQGQKLGLMSNTKPRTFPQGQCIEIVAAGGFMRQGNRDFEDGDAEHVTPYFYRHCRHVNVENPLGDFSQINMCVDTREDFARMEETINKMERPHTEYGWREIAELMA